MKTQQKMIVNLGVLDGIKEHLSEGTYVKVGVLGDSASRTGDTTINNVELGVIHELGSVTKNIPPRSFLRMPLQAKSDQLTKFIGSKKSMDMILKGNVNGALAMLGAYAESWIQSAFASRGFGQWKPNSPITIARKGSSAPLIDTGELRRSVSSEVVTP